MARKTSNRPATNKRRASFQPQDLLLAGIGAVSLGRREAIQAYASGVHGATQLRTRAERAVRDAAQAINGKAVALRKKATAQAAPVRNKVMALAASAKAEAGQRLAPVLVRLGVKPAPRKRAVVRKKTVAVRTRKAA